MKWISVKEGTPENKMLVLVFAKVRDIWGNDYNYIFTASMKEYVWVYDLSFADTVIITHWMPLPKPPKEKK